jgi:hypothetical protein
MFHLVDAFAIRRYRWSAVGTSSLTSNLLVSGRWWNDEGEARTKGVPTLGSGRIFPVAEQMLAIEQRDFPHMLRHGCGYALANAGHDTRALQAWLWGTRIFSIPCVTPSWRGIGLETSGGDRAGALEIIAQPKKVLAHDPDLLQETNQDRIVRTQKLTSSDPSKPII